MAIFYSNVGNGYRIILHVNVTSQDKVANKSTCSWVLQIETGHTYYDARHAGSVMIGGVVVWSEPDRRFNSSPSRSVKTIVSGSHTWTHEANGTKVLTVAAALRTITQGMSWSLPLVELTDTYVLPPIPRYPGAPGKPTYSVDHTGRKITVTTPTASSAAGVLEYQIERRYYTSSWTAWTAATANSSRQHTFSPGNAPKKFEFRSRARTAAGWGPYSATTVYTLVWKPKPLGYPTVTQDLSTRRITVTALAADASGSTITGYQIRRRDNWNSSDWVILTANLSTRKYEFTPVKPLTRFDFQARASTSAGWSDWGTVFSSIEGTGSGPWVRVSGVYKRSNAFVKVAGVWRPVVVWVKRDGIWRKAVR